MLSEQDIFVHLKRRLKETICQQITSAMRLRFTEWRSTFTCGVQNIKSFYLAVSWSLLVMYQFHDFQYSFLLITRQNQSFKITHLCSFIWDNKKRPWLQIWTNGGLQCVNSSRKEKNPNVCTTTWILFELSATRWKTYGLAHNSKRVDLRMFLMPILNSSPKKPYLGEVSGLEHLSN